ncbi:MAG: hypothetical protein GTN62_13160 [Gemmatimonadales bacterium]|nr:hypothetical protein [Gemmatimonadales bacterium]NIN12858.1 hypothetical protein [Gemmatimonadales bacterium]NIN51036.1 hypothetical protein [Gemmatimonadales bacterium]NIP08500.1 hypothetical protein [Gemmatimonadales bacterium]NIR02540.1 hypothetical protein [Gemmatimonadales bacterium]
MRSRLLLVGALACLGGPLQAQAARELQVQGVVTATATRFIGGGVGFALRTAGRMRVGLMVSAGDMEGAVAGRGEALLSYHLSPFKRRGVTPYVGGGVAVTATRDASEEYLLLVLGVESRPGSSAGWFAEAGVAGGVRVSLGFRLRQRSNR